MKAMARWIGWALLLGSASTGLRLLRRIVINGAASRVG